MVELVKQDYIKNKELYYSIENKLRNKLDISIPISHVGSTVIPDMYGKNIIDILIGAKDSNEFEYISKILEKIGFIPSGKSKDDIYQFFANTSNETSSGDIHIHLVIKNTERYNEFLILKEYLLNNEAEVKCYSDFKRDLISKNITDRKEYKRLKSEYVTALINRAKQDLDELI